MSFKRWCQPYANAHNLSHVLMDGGVLSIPFDTLRTFYDVYVRSVREGEQVFVVEQKTETYNFFLDIDYKDDEELSVDHVKSVAQIVCDRINDFGGRIALVSVAEPKPKDGKVKTGIHINWPGLVVNQNGAIQLMHHLISTLNNVYRSRDWSHDIDASVYGTQGKQGSGFRLPWSHKKAKGLTEGIYLPIFVYRDDALHVTDQEPTVEKLLMATVRTECRDVTEIPECVVLCRPVKKEGDFTPGELKNEVNNSELSALLETFIRKNMTGQEDTRIHKIYKCRNKYLVKTNSRYCENIRRNHSSNHVKIVIEPGGTIHQECFCRCETLEGRYHGMCKEFRSRPHELGPRIRDILYPKKCLFPSKKILIDRNAAWERSV
jgi:hypothetical protein